MSSNAQEALKDRIAAYRRSGDARVLLEDRALVEVVVLRAAQGWPTSGPLPPGADVRPGLEAAVTAGIFLWLRSQVLAPADRIDSLLEAADLLTAVRGIAPRAMPRQVAQALTAMTGGTRQSDHASVHDAAIAALTSDEARRGELATVDYAIMLLSAAVRSAAEDRHQPYYLSDLGTAWLDRFRITGRGRDLENSLAAHGRALAEAAQAPEDQAGLLANYSGALLAMFEHDGDNEILGRAVVAARMAMDLARFATRPPVAASGTGPGPDAGAGAGAQSSTGPAAGEQGSTGPAAGEQGSTAPDTAAPGALSAPELSGPMPVVPALSGERGAAIRLAQLASLSRLRAALLASYERDNHEVDLDEAVQVAREAASLVPAGDPAYPRYEASLAHVLRLQAARRALPAAGRHLADIPAPAGPPGPETVPMELPWRRS